MGQRIKQLREPMPQQRVIDRAGLDVTLRAYQAWEAGDSGISWDNLERLADFFEVTPEYLLSGTERRVSPDQLDRIEHLLGEVLTKLRGFEALAVAWETRERLRGERDRELPPGETRQTG